MKKKERKSCELCKYSAKSVSSNKIFCYTFDEFIYKMKRYSKENLANRCEFYNPVF